MVFAEGSSFVSLGVIDAALTVGDEIEGNVGFLGDSRHYLPFDISHFSFVTVSSTINYKDQLDTCPGGTDEKETAPPVETNVRGSLAFGIAVACGPTSLTMPRLVAVLAPDGLTEVSIVHLPSVGLGVVPRVRPDRDPFEGVTPVLWNTNGDPGGVGRTSTEVVRVEVGFVQFSHFGSRVGLVPVGLRDACPGVYTVMAAAL